MKIFTIPGWYKSEKYPESSIFVFEQMQALSDNGDVVIVLNAQPVSFKDVKKINTDIVYLNDNGVLTYISEFRAFYPSKMRFLHLHGFRKTIEKLFDIAIKEHGKPDVLYAHFSYPAGSVAVELSKKYHIPLVVEEHYSGLMEKRIDKGLLRCVRKSVDGACTFIAVSSALKTSIENMLGRKTNIKVISNMINDKFQFYNPVYHEGFVFFACGNLIPRKGFSELIQAFAKEFSSDKYVTLRIGGSGLLKSELEQLIVQTNMSGRIELLGQLTRDDTLSEYINCDCFVLPSKAETYGLVYREALAVGRPIISTMHGGFGCNDWNDKYGRLIPVDDEFALMSAMRYVYENYSEYNLKLISKLCLNDCSKESVALLIHNELEKASNILSRI